MNKQPSQELLSAYFDGEASIEERALVEQWLHDNPDARQELDDIAHISELIRSLPRESAPEELADSVLRQAERATLLNNNQPKPIVSSPRKTWQTQVAVVLASSAALVLLVAVIRPFSQNAVQNHLESLAVNEATNLDTSLDDDLVANSSVDRDRKLADSGEPKMASAEKALRHENLPDTPVAAKESSPAGKAGLPLPGTRMKSPAPPAAPAENSELLANGVTYPLNLKNARVGDVISHLDYSGQRVNIVNLTVVDVHKAVNSVQYLLSKNSIPIVNDQDQELQNRNSKTAKSAEPESNAPAPKLNAIASAVDPADDMLMVYVETKTENLASALKDLSHEKQIAELALEPAVDMEIVEIEESLESLTTPPDKPKANRRLKQADKRANVAVLAEQVRSNLSKNVYSKVAPQDPKPNKKEKQNSEAGKSDFKAQADKSEQAKDKARVNKSGQKLAPVVAAKPGFVRNKLARSGSMPSPESFQVQHVLSQKSTAHLKTQRQLYLDYRKNVHNQSLATRKQHDAKGQLKGPANPSADAIADQANTKKSFGQSTRRSQSTTRPAPQQQTAQQARGLAGQSHIRKRQSNAQQTVRVIFLFEPMNRDAGKASNNSKANKKTSP